MTATEKRKEEQEELLQSRKNRILESAFELFSEKGIDTIAMTDIAKKAEIGVASLYRYYETKEEIAIRTAIWAWKKQELNIMPNMESPDFINLDGFHQLKSICNVFVTFCQTQIDFLRFIYFFDSYAVRQHIPTKRMTDYESEIYKVQEIVIQAINKGFDDGSINPKYKNKETELYITIMHTLFSTSQKLSVSGFMLEMDKIYSPASQMNFLIEILLSDLKNK